MLLVTRFAVISLLTAATACSTPAVRTKVLGANHHDQIGSTGLTYYLPMRHAAVTFERTQADSKAAENLEKAEEALKAAQLRLKTAEAAAKAQSELIAALKKDSFDTASESFKGAVLDLAKAHQLVASAKVDVQAAGTKKDQAEEASRKFNEAQGMCGFVDAIKIELLPHVADTRKRYRLDPQVSSFRKDNVTLATTPSGLLRTVNSTLADQSSEILVSLAQSAAAVGSPISPKSLTSDFWESPAGDASSSCELWKPLTLKWIVNPTEGTQWNDVSQDIRDATKVGSKAFNYSITLRTAIDNSGTGSPTEGSTGHTSCGKYLFERVRKSQDTCGIYYRRERPILIQAKLDSQAIGGFLLVVPNDAPVDLLQVEATAFATNTMTFGFENGMLVNLASERPSPVLEVVSVPWKIARATMGILTEVVQFRVNHTTGQAEVIEQQVALANQLQALIDAQQVPDEAPVTRDGSTDP